MNNEEAKFVLRAYRPEGSDAGDPVFTEALKQAQRDPTLRAWLEHEQALDRQTAAKFREIAPPAGLRAAILAGSRASQPARRRATLPWWVAAAAVLALLAALIGGRDYARARPDFAQLALADLAREHDAHTLPAALNALQSQLASEPSVLPALLRLDVQELRRQGCRAVRWGGDEVFELCFQRDGAWFHVYVAPRGNFRPSGSDALNHLVSAGSLAAATWSDRDAVYALVTADGEKALRSLL